MAFGDGTVLQAAVALQPSCRVDTARPGEILETVIERQSTGGDGGGQRERLQRPGGEGENAGQRQSEIEAGKAHRRPQSRQKFFYAQDRARQRDPAAQRVSRIASLGCGPWR